VEITMPELIETPPHHPVPTVTKVLHRLAGTHGKKRSGSAMSFLVLQAYLKLIYFDVYVARGNFAALYNRVRGCPVRHRAPLPDPVPRICSAVDMACIWYWKRTPCLQRSAATACLLRRYGVPAQLVIGVQHLPFRAHAWVEVDSHVVNDKPYTAEMYLALDRC
jgi:Transglutaminase-like superfamily